MKDELLIKYFEDTLSPTEEKEFNRLLEEDKAFKEAFEFEKDTRIALIADKKQSLKTNFQQIEKQSRKSEVSTKKISFSKLAIAASFLLVAAWFGYQNFGNSPLSNNELYAANFEPYRNVIAPITRGTSSKDSLETAFYHYENKEYNTAIPLLEIRYKKTLDNYLLFYIGNAQLALGNTTKAITTLTKHQTQKDDFYEKSQWYLALAYLKENNTQQAITLLTTIKENQGYHYKKASEILKLLKP